MTFYFENTWKIFRDVVLISVSAGKIIIIGQMQATHDFTA